MDLGHGYDYPYGYPAYVMPLERLLALDRWTPHQTLLGEGQLVEALPGDGKSIIFVSHQWRGTKHPDLSGEQLKILQNTLRALRTGQCKVRANFLAEALATFSFVKNKNSQAARKAPKLWKGFLQESYIWLDYLSVPQPTVESDPEVRVQVARQMWMAVQCIVNYVCMATAFVVLAPPLVRTEPPAVPVNYGSWQYRGWCLMERTSWILSGAEGCQGMLVIEGDSLVTLERSDTYLPVTLGTADWTNPDDRKSLVPCLMSLLEGRMVELKRMPDFDGMRDLLQAQGRLFQKLPGMLSQLEGRLSAMMSKQYAWAWIAQQEPKRRESLTKEMQRSMVKAFLGQCALRRVKSKDSAGRTALHIASAQGDIQLVTSLLSARADARAKTTGMVSWQLPPGATPIHFAAAFCTQPREEAEKVLTMLIEARCSVHACGTGPRAQALHFAAAMNNVTMTALLLDHEADIHAQDRFTATPILLSCAHSCADVLPLLIERKASLSVNGCLPFTPVHMTSVASSAERVLPLLLSAGQDPNQFTSPFTHLDTSVKMLLGAIRLVWSMGRRSRFGMQLIMSQKAPLTPLMSAAIVGNIQAVQALVGARADASVRNSLGLAALDYAAMADELCDTNNTTLKKLLGAPDQPPQTGRPARAEL